MPAVGGVLLVAVLGLNAIFVRMWRRPPYRYEGEYRKPWDDAASLTRQRAEQARRAAVTVGGPDQDQNMGPGGSDRPP